MPTPQYSDLDSLLRAAKLSLARADALDATVPKTAAPAPVRPAAPRPVDNSTWGKIKSVANWSPLPETIGDEFASTVDADSVRDAKAMRGEYGPLDTLKSFFAGSGKGFMDTLRGTGTPVGLATLGGAPESKVGRMLAGAGSAIFAGEGAEPWLDPHSSVQDKAFGAAQVAMGGAGLLGALGGGHVPERARVRTPEPEMVGAPTPAPPTEPIPVSKFDGSGRPQPLAASIAPETGPQVEHYMPNKSGYEPPAPPAPEPSPTASFFAHQDDFEGGSLPLYNVQGGEAHGSTVSADTLRSLGIDIPETPPYTPPAAAAPTKPRIAADEFASILRGRQKFADTNPAASLPPGARDEMDRMGLEYTRTQSELKRLLGMPDADPGEVGRMTQGARELGSRLRRYSKDVAAPPPAPATPPSSLAEMLQASIESQEADKAARAAAQSPDAPGRAGHFRLPEAKVPDDVYTKIRESKGIAPSPLERADRPITGGGEELTPTGSDSFTAEYPFHDNPEAGSMDPALLANLMRVPAGAAVGAYFDPENRGRGALIGGGLGAATLHPGVGKNLERARYFSMLAGPAQLKNVAGNIGVVGSTAAERALTHGPSEGLNVLKEFFSPETASSAARVFKGEEVPLARMDQPTSTSDKGIMGLPFRAMGAADEATKGAMTRAGVEDAAERTFTSDPKTDIGKAVMQLQRKGGSLARVVMPFVKTAINQAEAGTTPLANLFHLNEMTPVERKQALAKAAVLAGYGAAGAAYGNSDFANDHPALSPFAAVLAGAGALPFAVSQQYSHARHEGKNEAQSLQTAGTELGHQLPMPSEWAFSPAALLASYVPTILKFLNPDDTERDTTGSVFGPALSRIPGLSKTLPPKSSARTTRHRFSNE